MSTVSETAAGVEMAANRGVRDSRATQDPGGRPPSAGKERVSAGSGTRPVLPAPKVPRQALAPLKHGGRSAVALAPSVRGVKRELCKRLGVRYQDLDAAGKEAVTNYSRATSKLAAMDRWFSKHPVIDDSGVPSPALSQYWTGLNAANRALGRVLDVLEAMAREDSRFDTAVQALILEGRKMGNGQGNGDG